MKNHTLETCPYCNNLWTNIVESNTTTTYKCSHCGISLDVKAQPSQPEKAKSILPQLLSSNTPTIITSSYKNLIHLLNQDEIYGALIKIKDIFELTIKFPLVLILSHISNKLYTHSNKESDFSTEFNALHEKLQDFINSAISSQLALGHWANIAGTIQQYDLEILFPHTDIPNCLKPLLNINKKNHTFFSREDITFWRNKTIGHGALNCNKDEVKEDIYNKLKKLNGLLLDCINDYAEIEIISNADSILLNSTTNKNNKSILVKPFIDLNTGNSVEHNQNEFPNPNLDNLFIFESYNDKKNTGYTINYSNGKKYLSNDLTQILAIINKNLKSSSILKLINVNNFSKINDNTILTTEIELLESLQKTNFYKGDYFSNWFINCLNFYSGGIFLCCAERGMGKSAFTRAIDQLETVKIKDNAKLINFLRDKKSDLLIRTFHFNSYYNSDVLTFITKLKDIFTSILITEDNNTSYLKSIIYIAHNIEQQYLSLYKSINDKSISNEEKKNLFLKFLKSLQSLWKYKYQKQKLILVLDGIDEISNTENRINIIDFLPHNTDLQSHGLTDIYIILTCRCENEIKSNHMLHNFITTYQFTDKLVLTREIGQEIYDSIYSKSFITDIKKSFSISDDYQAINLANTLEWRYNYLTAFKKLYSSNPSKDLQSFINDPFDVYLSQLATLSKSYVEDIKYMLNLLTMTNEGLTISEISYLITGDNNPTFKLYGMLMDIINFLNVERSYQRGTLFNISHPDWIDKINSNKSLSENKKVLIANLKKQLDNLFANNIHLNDFSTPNFDGESWLISNIDNIGIATTDAINTDLNIDFGENLYQIHRSITLNNYIISKFKSQDLSTLGSLNAKKYIIAQLNIAKCYSKLNDFDKCFSNCDIAISLCNKLNEFIIYDKNFIHSMFATTYYRMAIIFQRFSDVKREKEFYLKAINLIENLANDYNHSDDSYNMRVLAKSYNNLAILLKNINPNKSKKYYLASIDINEKLNHQYKNEPSSQESLAKSYKNLAILQKETNPKESKKLYFTAIKIREKLAEDYKNSGRFFDLNNLASSYNSLALFLKESNPNRSKVLYFAAIKIREKLAEDYKNGGRFFDLNNLASSYNSLAIFFKKYNPDEAEYFYNESIKIREQLAKDYENGGRFFDLNKLASSYRNLSLFLKTSNPKRAVKLYLKSIKIREQLAKDYENGGRFFDLNELASSYNSLAILLKKSNPDEAKYFYNESVKIREKLADEYKNGGRFFDLNELASSYNNLAIFLKKSNPDEAEYFYNEAIKIREQLADDYKNGGRFFDLNELASSYNNFANFLKTKSKAEVREKAKKKTKEKAKNLYDKAIKIREQLADEYKNNGRFFDLELLTKTYNKKNELLTENE